VIGYRSLRRTTRTVFGDDCAGSLMEDDSRACLYALEILLAELLVWVDKRGSHRLTPAPQPG
jgi:hypothetical protein